MKENLNKIVLLIAAIAVFTTGMGVNVFNYCCTDCQSNISIFTSEDCCAIHNETAHNHDGTVASCQHHHEAPSTALAENCMSGTAIDSDSHCSVTRLSIDLDSSNSRPQVSAPFTWLSSVPILLSNFVPQYSDCPNTCEHMPEPPIENPRDYLSFIRILVI